MAYKKVEKTTSKIGVTELPLVAIAPDPNQPRKEFEVPALQELADSIKKHGVLQPIMVQPDADGFQLVFGERRMRAARMAGLTTIPAIISQPLTEDQALEIQVLENLHRKNINPMEESDAFNRLINKKIATAKQLADKLGVSVKYVYDRLALQSCILEVKEKIREGVFTIGTGKKFARLALNDQRELFDDVADDDNIDLDHLVTRQFTRDLDDVPFDIEDAALHPVAGACTTCQKRSGCNKLLFDDIVEESICFDSECFNTKMQANTEMVIQKLEAEGKAVVRISGAWRPKIEGVVSRSEWGCLEIGEDEDKPVHQYGVIVHDEYGTHKIGRIVKLAAPDEEEDQDEDDDFDSTDAETVLSRASKTLVVGNYQRKRELQMRLAKALFESYSTVNAKDALKYFIEREIIAFTEEDAVKLASIIGIVAKDEDGTPIEEPDEYQIAEASKELPIELLYKAAQFLMHYDDLRIDSIEDIEKANAISGLDATAVIEAYKSETGWSPVE